MIADLRDKDVGVRRATTTAIERAHDMKWFPSEPVRKALLPVLFDTLGDTDADVRTRAALAWVRFNGGRSSPEREAQVLLSVLLDALQNREMIVRRDAASSLVTVNRDPKVVLAPLSKLLKDSDEQVCSAAASALKAVDPPTAAVPALIGALDDERARVRHSAAANLAWIGEPAKAAVP
ncbi:MAG TPA: HEAT repeat domain-containing protein, partial [Gemmataceae bacterium]